MKLVIGCDHGGLVLKDELRKRLEAAHYEVLDCGVFTPDMVDYPDVAVKTIHTMFAGGYDAGILICGTGIGMSIAANKIPGVRAALCSDVYSAKMARAHNDANVITLGARTLGVELAWEIVKAYLGESFLGGIHQGRVEKLNAMGCAKA